MDEVSKQGRRDCNVNKYLDYSRYHKTLFNKCPLLRDQVSSEGQYLTALLPVQYSLSIGPGTVPNDLARSLLKIFG